MVRQLGVEIQPIDAAEVHQCIKALGILDMSKKPIKTKTRVIFPIITDEGLSEHLSSTHFAIRYHLFPERAGQKSITERLLKKYPDLAWDSISLKFDQLGNIAVLKLDPKKTTLDFRQRIGDGILKMHPKIQSVVNKSDVITGVERTYPLEHLAGVENTQGWHREYGLWIYFDLNQTYLNPRLAEEHHRIALASNSNEKILDMFTGVGPFALHCAKRLPCRVVAIDINPWAINALKRSIIRNKLRGTIDPLLGDSTQVLRRKKMFNRVIINLPQVSSDYIGIAAALLEKGGIITFYQFFPKTDDLKDQITTLIDSKLASCDSYKVIYSRIGRDVSPSRVQVNIDVRIG